ncbi:ankyrin repeat domain-containing protein [Cerasicoccus maritimus]|uniref:ankyrin repeat domain-containing protein n=1 Tax=Cerasicoccus maritimus TaxID=490089 RepID=UPI002852ABC1|nr:hypothetical protein [Cerasicoccus maritimus]
MKQSPDPQWVSPLPAKPNWEQQQKRAKQLLRAYWKNEPDAVERIRALHPKAPTPAESKLLDAQLVIARGYGFASWAKLKLKIESLTQTPVEQFVAAVKRRDLAAARALLESHVAVRAQINAPLFSFDSMAVHAVADDLEFLAMLKEFGADLNSATQWKCGGFTLLDQAKPELLPQLLELGASLTVFAAARLNLVNELRAMLESDPALARARGGDGQTPLHVAASTEVIDLLVQYGADLDARDVDHTATPAQYLVGQPNLCRHLLSLGTTPDLFMAVMLNDVALAQRCIEQDPICLEHRIGLPPYANDEGGHIYIWQLKVAAPLELARRLKHKEVEAFLNAHSPESVVFLDALWRADEVTAKKLLTRAPESMRTLANGSRLMAEAAWECRLDSVKLMLDIGLDPHARGVHESTPLDRAAFHGYAEVVALLLERDPNPPLTARNEFGGQPLMTCNHGAQYGWETGKPRDHVAVTKLLLNAGAPLDPSWMPTGHEALDECYRKHWLAPH